MDLPAGGVARADRADGNVLCALGLVGGGPEVARQHGCHGIGNLRLLAAIGLRCLGDDDNADAEEVVAGLAAHDQGDLLALGLGGLPFGRHVDREASLRIGVAGACLGGGQGEGRSEGGKEGSPDQHERGLVDRWIPGGIVGL